jgi:hypothetical protein
VRELVTVGIVEVLLTDIEVVGFSEGPVCCCLDTRNYLTARLHDVVLISFDAAVEMTCAILRSRNETSA